MMNRVFAHISKSLITILLLAGVLGALVHQVHAFSDPAHHAAHEGDTCSQCATLHSLAPITSVIAIVIATFFAVTGIFSTIFPDVVLVSARRSAVHTALDPPHFA